MHRPNVSSVLSACAVAFSVAGVPQPAAAQEFKRPICTATIHDPVRVNYPAPPDPVGGQQLIELVGVDGFWGTDAEHSAIDAANGVANVILALKYPASGPSRIPNGQLRICFFNFGTDTPLCDDPQSVWYTWPSRMFHVVEDALPGMNPGPFPWHGDGVRTDRTYRHPFLINAGFVRDPANPPVNTLRQWMVDFVAAYKARQAAQLLADPNKPLPTPDAFWFDTEATIAEVQDPNATYMLWWLTQNTTIWNTWEVPGYAPGTTLATLYAAARPKYNLPATPAMNFQNFDPSETTNRPYMQFWYGVTQHTTDHILKLCAYDVLKGPDGFPGCVVGNYGDMRTDGEQDTFGWFQKRPNNGNPGNPHATDYVTTRTYPRGFIHPQYGGFMWQILGTTTGTQLFETGRWVCQTLVASGDRDAPYIYPLSDDQFNGTGWIYGHKQPSLYSYNPMNIDETWMQSSLRLHRHTVESCINSFGGMHGERLQPWVTSVLTYSSGEWGRRPWFGPEEARDELAMLRGKNVPEITFWSEFYITGQHANAYESWIETSRAVRDVWAPRIIAAKVNFGNESQATTTDRSARLDFTLRDAQGNDRTVDVASDHVPFGTTALEQTQVEVEFSGLDGLAYPPLDRYTGLQINIECRTVEEQSGSSDVVGMLLIRDWTVEGRWVAVNKDRWIGVLSNTYRCMTPAIGANPSVYENRKSFEVDLLNDNGSSPYVDASGHVRLRLVHFGAEPFTSQYDLVQVVPFNREMPPGTGGVPLPISDTNFDGLVGSEDFANFVEAWLQGKGSADINQDGVVDEVDMDLYISAYIEEQ